jgi:hypothetical protein
VRRWNSLPFQGYLVEPSWDAVTGTRITFTHRSCMYKAARGRQVQDAQPDTFIF